MSELALSPGQTSHPSLPGVDWLVLASLLVMFTSSLWVFLVLARRATHTRERERLREWAKQSGFRLRCAATLPAPLSAVAPGAIADVQLLAPHATMVRLRTRDNDQPQTWHLAIAELPASSVPIGLRPASAPRSFLDRFGIPVSPVSQDSLRFTLLCAEIIPARRLAGSIVRGILPADVGLLRIGQHLLLDFSSRQFDPIELTRMASLLRQIVLSMP
jgi:hypothetical protein